jgi:hypothetical protein
MALQDFRTNMRMGARLFAPRHLADAPPLDADAIERMLRSSVHWLTVRSVSGFDEKDFWFLPEGERAQLAQLVTDFQKVVSTVKRRAPTPEETVEKAMPLFRDLVRLLAFDRYGDAEAFRLGKLIEGEIAPERPPELADLRFMTGLDHTGDPGLWIWVYLSDDASESDERFLEVAQMLQDFLDPVAREVAPDRWPYISFRSIADQFEPVED